MTQSRFFLLLAAPLLGMALLAATLSDEHPFSGTYVLNEEASDDVMEAFEPMLQEMNFVMRRLARSRIGDAVQPDERLRIEQTRDEITIQSGDGPAITTPATGDVVERETKEGTLVKLSAHIEDDVLHQRVQMERGSYLTRYRLNPGGEQLTMEVTLDFERLPEPISYRLVYNRA